MRHLALRHARFRPAAFVAALAVATTGLLGGTAAPAAAAEPTPTRLAVTPLSVSKSVGTGVTFTFTLSTAEKRLGGKTISIYTRPKGDLNWTKRWTQTLNAYGNSKVAFTVQRSTYIKATYAGSSLYAPSTSKAAYVAALSSLGTRVIQEASRHAGKPYQWGAVGPDRFDCSGFTLYVFKKFGKYLPHNSGQQYNSVRKVAKSDKRVGDLIFTYNSGGIHHVAIYAGNGYIWHSPRSGSVVNKSKMWSSSYYVGRVA
jgi:cell wall-associated NlpC family hydrolase